MSLKNWLVLQGQLLICVFLMCAPFVGRFNFRYRFCGHGTQQAERALGLSSRSLLRTDGGRICQRWCPFNTFPLISTPARPSNGRTSKSHNQHTSAKNRLFFRRSVSKNIIISWKSAHFDKESPYFSSKCHGIHHNFLKTSTLRQRIAGFFVEVCSWHRTKLISGGQSITLLFLCCFGNLETLTPPKYPCGWNVHMELFQRNLSPEMSGWLKNRYICKLYWQLYNIK